MTNEEANIPKTIRKVMTIVECDQEKIKLEIRQSMSEQMRKFVEEENKAFISDFIHRRFPTDSNWSAGNCYHFALILSDVFDGSIYYDVKLGHFLAKIGESYYDYHGLVKSEPHYIPWCDFPEYDRFQYARIKRDCIY